jgi:hypothetical protein
MIALDPELRFPVTLDIEADKPLEARRKILCRFLTARQVVRFDQMTDLVKEAATISEKVSKLEEALKFAGIEDAILAELTVDQMWDLANKIPVESRLAEIERKKSALQSASAAQAKSAGPAPAAGA